MGVPKAWKRHTKYLGISLRRCGSKDCSKYTVECALRIWSNRRTKASREVKLLESSMILRNSAMRTINWYAGMASRYAHEIGALIRYA